MIHQGSTRKQIKKKVLTGNPPTKIAKFARFLWFSWKSSRYSGQFLHKSGIWLQLA